MEKTIRMEYILHGTHLGHVQLPRNWPRNVGVPLHHEKIDLRSTSSIAKQVGQAAKNALIPNPRCHFLFQVVDGF
jgi:hypothetical protein